MYDKKCSIQNVTQVILATNKETKKSHPLCPHCFSHPPQNSPYNELKLMSDFRCLNCSHDTCPLAGKIKGGEVDVAPCPVPSCGGTMRLGKVDKRFKLQCSKEKSDREHSWWFPGSVK